MTINQALIRKILAREWLYLLAGFAVGLVVVPGAIGLFLDQGVAGTYGAFYGALFDGYDRGMALLVTFSPYLFFQLARSIRWAVKATRQSGQ